jgi:hypothetical protein
LGDELLESNIQHRVVERARARGVFVRKLTAMAWRGFPDLFMARDGIIVLWEVKATDGRVTPLQAAEHRALRDDGGVVVLVTYGLQEAYRNLDAWFPLENIT